MHILLNPHKNHMLFQIKKKNLRYGDTKLHVPHGLTAGNGANTST